MKPENESSVAVQVRFGTWAGQCDFLPKAEAQGGISLANQGLIELEAAQTNALMSADVFIRPELPLTLSETGALDGDEDNLSALCPEDGDCLIGFSVAIAIETAMAFSLYGIWRACHLIW